MHKIVNLHDWISELPQEIRAEVEQLFTTRKLSDGECLYHQGDKSDACFQVLEGRLKICNFNYTGQEMVHAYLVKGDCTGDWGLILNQPRMNNCIACGDTEVKILKKSQFDKLYDKHPVIAKAINLVMARRLRLLFMLAEDASLLPLNQRLARVVIRMGYSLGYVTPDGQAIIEDVSHDELSKMVGSTRQSVGRELKKFEQEGAIEIKYGKLIIKNITAFCEQYDRLLSVEPIVPDYRDVEQ